MNGRTIPKEVELKLELPPASLRALRKVPLFKTPPTHTREISVYFDTDKQKLRKNGLMLRVRRTRNRYVQTIKATNNSGPFERDEWEAELAGQEPDLRMAEGTALEQLANDKLRRQLKPLFETRVHRSVYPIADDRRAIALTVDRGSIDTGNHSMPLCEIELELQRGKLADLFDVARELSRTLPVRIAVKSKSHRGYELLDGMQHAPVKGKPIDLPRDGITRDAFKTIGIACLGQIIGNEPAVLRDDPEGVHQMRVGLRRLRAGMSLFSDLLHDPQTATIKSGLKWLAAELGPARELEVLVNRVIAPMKKQRVRWEGVPSLSQQIKKKRKAALTRAKNAVNSARFRALTLELAAWLQAGQWTTPRDDLVRDRGDLMTSVFAAEQLTRRWRKLRKKRKPLAQLDAPNRHKLRILAKKLRYAVEFFASLFASRRQTKRRRSLLKALEQLQDSLGELNDIAVDEQRLTVMGFRRGSNRNRIFAAGLLTGRENARAEAAMVAATKAHEEVTKVKPFWP